jgi:hypothetical protein
MSVPSSIPSTEDKTYQHDEFNNKGPKTNPNLTEMTNKMQLCRTIYYSIVP